MNDETMVEPRGRWTREKKKTERGKRVILVYGEVEL